MLTYLNKYNGEWVDLPCSTEELEERIAYIGGEEHAIHDYELPFTIDEYDNPFTVNELCQLIEDNNIDERIVKIVTDCIGGGIQQAIDCLEQQEYSASFYEASNLDLLGQEILAELYGEAPKPWHNYIDGEKFVRDLECNGAIIEDFGSEYVVVTMN